MPVGAVHAGGRHRSAISTCPAGRPFFDYMKTNPYYQFANYTLSVIPLFILMGALAEHSGMSASLFRAAEAFAGHMRGGLAMAVIWRLHGFRRDLRLVGGDHGDLRPGRAAGAAALQVRRRLRHRHHRGRRHARHPHPAVDHPGRLRHHHRAEHRQAVQGGAHPGPDGRALLHARHRLDRAPPARTGAAGRDAGRATGARRCRRSGPRCSSR